MATPTAASTWSTRLAPDPDAAHRLRLLRRNRQTQRHRPDPRREPADSRRCDAEGSGLEGAASDHESSDVEITDRNRSRLSGYRWGLGLQDGRRLQAVARNQFPKRCRGAPHERGHLLSLSLRRPLVRYQLSPVRGRRSRLSRVLIRRAASYAHVAALLTLSDSRPARIAGCHAPNAFSIC